MDTTYSKKDNDDEKEKVDDQLMDTSYSKKENNDEKERLSKLRDDQIRDKKKKRAVEEEMYLKNKEKKFKEDQKKRAKSVKKSKKKRNKKKDSINNESENNHKTNLPDRFRHVPVNIKHLVKPDDLILRVEPNGACGHNAAAGHIFEDEKESTKLRCVVSNHILKHWLHYVNKDIFP